MNGKLRLFARYVRPYSLRVAGLSALVFAETFVEGAGVGLLYPLLQYIQEGPSFLQHGAAKIIFDALAVVGVPRSTGSFIALMFVVVFAALALRFAVLYTDALVYSALMRDVRDDAFRKVLGSHLFNFYASSSAELAQTIETEVEYLGNCFDWCVSIAASGLSILTHVAIALLMSWKLTAAVAALALARYAISGFFVKRMVSLGESYGRLQTELKNLLISIHQGIDVVKSFGMEAREEKRFMRLSNSIRDNGLKIVASIGANAFFEGLLGQGILCVLVYVAVSRLTIHATALLTFLFVVARIVPKITVVNDMRVHLADYLNRIRLLPTVLEGRAVPALKWGDAAKPRFEDRITLRGVSFGYPASEEGALSDINLEVRRNETLAIVGESGSGKTTLARLLLRLFDPTAGEISIDGIPLPQLKREDWVRLVSVVSQDTFVFDDTVENNIKYGVEACSQADFAAAVSNARAGDFIQALPEKERTVLGERGVRLSGGQRQRIAIARAFLRNAPILILDEATSAMDAVTEKQIQDAIAELAQQRTMIVIAHRLATVRNADRIAVLEKGRIAELGTHDQLLSDGLLYRRYHDLQLR